ncbi:MAG TPA: sigma-70 family RNA polymerase sigma factor [bacterium]|nr:sigma-70 family RNA polymerase sigma factor [bacterium]
MSIRFRGYPNWPRREVRAGSEVRDGGDDQLMAQLAAGRQDALGPLYRRYAPRLYSLAAQSLDRTSAEEIVQEVFLQVWRKAATYRPERGTFKAWVFQIAHHRILNELRRRRRRPQLDEDPDGLRLAAAPDPVPGPDEVVEAEAERVQVRAALASLPEAQRLAVEMAFVEGLTHTEVAKSLRLPLGTTKTRIRAGLQRLRAGLAPAVAAAVIVAGIGAIAGIRNEQASRALDGRALALLTSSETAAIRLDAAPGVPPETHAVYRGHTGATIAVLNLEKFRPAPAGEAYQAWVRHGETWTSLGTIRPDAGGEARLIVEGPAVDRLPDAIEVTLEPARGSPSPHGPVIVTGRPGPPVTRYR